ncbi:MAG: hypothetical protein RL272_515 [Candidatus Parcubacteria bacterium]|jgi:magnesium transporter
MPKRKKGQKTRLQEIATGSPVTWINVTDPDEALLLKTLKSKYPFFLEMDLRDCLPPFQRPKLLEREQYLFMVLLFPIYDQSRRTVLPYEVDFFIGKDFLVTSHRGTHETLTQLAEACGAGSDSCVLRHDDNALRLALDVVHGLVVSCFPLVTSLSNDLIAMEQRIFDEESDGTVVKDMLRLKTSVVGFREAMQGYENVMKKLMDRGHRLFPVDELRAQYEDIAGHGREIWAFLENDRDTVNALADAHLTLATHKTNHAMKTLTALAFIIFPMNLVAAIFSMDAKGTPFSGQPNDFWMMLSVIFATMLTVVLFLKKKRWL